MRVRSSTSLVVWLLAIGCAPPADEAAAPEDSAGEVTCRSVRLSLRPRVGVQRFARGSLLAETNDPEQAARACIDAHRDEFEVDPADLSLVKSDTSIGGTYLRFQQTVELSQGGSTEPRSLPVFDGQVVARLARRGGEYELGDLNLAQRPLSGWQPPEPSLSSEQAMDVAGDVVALAGDLYIPPKSLLGVYAPAGEEPRLAWQVDLVPLSPPADWRVLVDAVTGEVISLRDRRIFATGSAYVFDPNPIATSGTTTLTDSSDSDYAALTAERVAVTLTNLDGSGYLQGSWVDSEPNLSYSASNTFNHTRSQDEFEEENVYYHIDIQQERVQGTLGITGANDRVQVVNVNGTTDDNSWYSPSTYEITTGTGGVDDAEDADIVIHEYGHSMQDDQVPGFGASDEAGAMGEGFGDYLGSAHSVALTSDIYDTECLGEWDAVGYGSSCLRRMDGTKHYPEAWAGEVHDDGEMWSAALWAARGDIGGDEMDAMVIEHHFLLSTTATMLEASDALLSTETTLYGGAYQDTLRRDLVAQGVSRELTAEPTGLSVLSTQTVDIANASSGGRYVNNLDDVQSYTFAGAEALQLHFDVFSTEDHSSCVDGGCDNVYLTNGDGDLFAFYHGSLGAFDSVIVSGDTVYIRLVSDVSVRDTGYHIDSIDILGTASTDADGDGEDASTDCDDSDATVYTGATELCDGQLNDCSGSMLAGEVDADGDGFAECSLDSGGWDGAGTVAGGDDCDDGDDGVNPGAAEVCDAADTDEDCDGLADDADSSVTGQGSWYGDADGDGYGAGASSAACDQPSDTVDNADDCDDGDAGVNPAATEVCDAADTDEDCDGLADDADPGVTGTTTWYLDSDGDGYGSSTGTEFCDAPTGTVTDTSDCDDSDASVHPGATEVCDAADTDEDCNGLADNADSGATGTSTFYTDDDGDGYGDLGDAGSDYCDAPAGTASTATDCDDGDAGVNPGAAEVCDAADTDEDCDGLADDADSSVTGQGSWYGDADGDGYGAGASSAACDQPSDTVDNADDCDDGEAGVNPAAAEVCDAADTDEDCDGLADDADPSAAGQSTWYADTDGDGYGDPSNPSAACEQPSDTLDDDRDCDDAAADIHPGATETCDGVDNDCDGDVDEAGATGESTWYVDSDGDGYGDPATTVEACDEPSTAVSNSDDCDDGAARIHPGANERCGDGLDNNCDGAIDDGTAVDARTWYYDLDADGYGDADNPVTACVQPSSTVSDDSDCDDAASSIHPGATEICDDLDTDEDCDGEADERGAYGEGSWYTDVDGDGWGTSSSTRACEQPSGTATRPGDCDDADDTIYAGATEVCDAADNDCDGRIDEAGAVGEGTWYTDTDGDGYGVDGTGRVACVAPVRTSGAAGDCDDSSVLAYPGADEYCDRVDNDCDGEIDEDIPVDADTWYRDADADGYGDADSTAVACTAPSGYRSDDRDCDDDDRDVYPGSRELCDGVDNDCDGDIDESGSVDELTWYADDDGDGYGDPASSLAACTMPTGMVSDASDCDDSDADTWPGADETCDGADNDCDGGIDELGALDETTWFADADGDGYGVPDRSTTGCTAPMGMVSTDTDCDDAAATVNPGASEACDGVDNDCDGEVDEPGSDAEPIWYTDADRDGYGDGDRGTAACDAPSGTTSDGTDCDDRHAVVNPGATEICDDVDNDCDGEIDELGVTDGETYYRDADGDGHGSDVGTTSCGLPDGYTTTSGDCYDGDDAVHPGADEICDGLDNDCDGEVDEYGAVDEATWYDDDDGDGYGDARATLTGCEAPSGAVADATDCDDTEASVHPGAPEACDGLDTDCDESTDELADLDGDGLSLCDGDCDDEDPEVHPDASEVCDGIDNDCDPETDESGDMDGDGVTQCDGDCDDANASTRPGATELCDGEDNDCNGFLSPGEADFDRDGQGTCEGDCDDRDPDTWLGAPELCDGEDNDCDGDAEEDILDVDGDGYSACDGDCEDADGGVRPGAAEACDGVDTNCDGVLPAEEADVDGDGFLACEADCDDFSEVVWPGNVEVCDGLDNDCDGLLPEPELDLDGDGFASCEGDCNDADASVSPGSHEVGAEACSDGVDNDCDGLVDAEETACGFAGVDDTGGSEPVVPSEFSGTSGGCGCGAAGTASPASGLGLLGLLALVARRRRDRGHAAG